MKVSIIKISAMMIGLFLFAHTYAQPQRPDKEEVFTKIDNNDDGFIDLEEFKAGAEKRREDKMASENSRKAFDKMDTNNNGTIEFEEFEAVKEKRMERRAERFKPEELFGKIDANGDGMVSKEEFMAHDGPRGRRK